MSSLGRSHSIFSNSEIQLREGIAGWPFYATALPSSIRTLRAHAAGVVWLEHGTSGVTVKVLDAVSEQERMTLLQILNIGSVSEPALRIMEALDEHSPFLALLRGQEDQDLWRAIAGAHPRVAHAWLLACPTYVLDGLLVPSQLRDRIAGIIWLCAASRGEQWFDQLAAAPRVRLLKYIGLPSTADDPGAPEIATFVHFWSSRLAPFRLPFPHRQPDARVDPSHTQRAGRLNDCQLVISGEQASNAAVHALLAHEAAVVALRQAQVVERECARSAARSEKAAELLANQIMEQLGQAGPPTALELACKRSKAVDPSSSCKQEGGVVFTNIHGKYYPPAPACHDIPIQPFQDYQRCAFARHIPFSPLIVGRKLGSKVAALVTCWACGDKAHVKGECPTLWGKAGRPLPGFDVNGSQAYGAWEGKDPSVSSLRAWERFVAKESNFPEQALPARFTGAPERGDFVALAEELEASIPSLRSRVDMRNAGKGLGSVAK